MHVCAMLCGQKCDLPTIKALVLTVRHAEDLHIETQALHLLETLPTDSQPNY